MKKILLLIVIGVVALVGGVGAAALVGSSGSAKTLCVEGFNYKTNLNLTEYQTSPAGPLIGVYKNQQPWVALYPVLELSNVAQGYDMTAPAFTTKAGWKVYTPKQRPADGSVTYAVDADMPFILISDAGGATEAQMRLFLDGLKPGRCPSPNPGVYDEPVELAEEEVYQAPTAEEMVALCEGLQLAVLETKCVKAGPSASDPSVIVYAISARVKNEGSIPVQGISVSTVYETGAKSSAHFDVTIAPGVEQWIAPQVPVGTKSTNALELTPKPDRMTFCPDVAVRAPLDCAENSGT